MADFQTEEAPVVSETRRQELLTFTEQNNLHFTRLSLLDNAFTHSSYANESRNRKIRDNERLEFLGDSVLSVVISDWLFHNLEASEGEYTRIRSFVVNEDSLSGVASKLRLFDYILIGKGEEQTGGRHKKAILADCMEAVFAAVFLDMGFEKVKEFILSLLVPYMKEVISNRHKKDYKTMLQEYVQKCWKKVPEYTLVETKGPDHDMQFFFIVEFQGKKYGPAGGHNKKDAEQNAARLACEDFNIV